MDKHSRTKAKDEIQQRLSEISEELTEIHDFRVDEADRDTPDYKHRIDDVREEGLKLEREKLKEILGDL